VSLKEWSFKPGGLLCLTKGGSSMNNNFKFPFEKLEVWHLAVDLADFVLNILDSLPPDKYLRMVGQMEAAVTSIPQNIAEGKGRQYKKEFIQYLYIAEGSLFEVLALSEIFRRRKLFKENESMEIRERAEIIDRKLHGLINSLKGKGRVLSLK
jgi:four helix bundle protein